MAMIVSMYLCIALHQRTRKCERYDYITSLVRQGKVNQAAAGSRRNGAFLPPESCDTLFERALLVLPCRIRMWQYFIFVPVPIKRAVLYHKSRCSLKQKWRAFKAPDSVPHFSFLFLLCILPTHTYERTNIRAVFYYTCKQMHRSAFQ